MIFVSQQRRFDSIALKSWIEAFHIVFKTRLIFATLCKSVSRFQYSKGHLA
jgi:hypothetical protein